MKKRRYTAQDVKNKITEKFNGKYILLDLEEYNGNPKIIVKVLCTDCKTIFEIKLYGLLFENHKHYCPTCRQNERKNNFIKRVYDECGDEYIPLSEYKTCKDKVLFRHNKPDCMNEFWMTPDVFFNGDSRCPVCMHRQGADKLFLSNEEFQRRIKDIHGDEFDLLEDYNGYEGRIKIRHKKCGREFKTLCGDLLQGKGCRYCAGKMLKTTEQFKNEIYELYKDEYSVIGDYVNAKTKISMRHNICGYIWDVHPNTILERKLCPHCAKSYGEKQLENFVIHNDIDYKTQETFNDCKDNDYLKFDLSIYVGEKLLCLVEYDGEGHFRPVCFGGITKEEALENFKTQKRRDEIKNSFCKNNNIPLLRISYKNKENIYSILSEYLYNNFGIKTNTPTYMYVDKLKTPYIKFIDYIETLPNGIYPKAFFEKMFLNNSQKISTHIFNKSIVKQYFKNNNISLNRHYILLNRNCDDDYDAYIKFGIENNFDFEVFRNIKTLFYLKDGVYGRHNLDFSNRATTKSITYEFYQRMLKQKNIKIEHSCIRVNSEDKYTRPDWLLFNRKEVI